MLYFSLDLETTGLDFDSDQIIEFGAIFEDPNIQHSFEEIPKFKRIIRYKKYNGSAVAINMNARIFKILAEYEMKPKAEKEEFAKLHNIIAPENLMDEFQAFVIQCYLKYDLPVPAGGINVAGKNFGTFDLRFIEAHKRDWLFQGSLKIKNRIADPGPLFVNWYTDENIPGLLECKEKAGVKGVVTHDALEDAWDVIQVLRKKY